MRFSGPGGPSPLPSCQDGCTRAHARTAWQHFASRPSDDAWNEREERGCELLGYLRGLQVVVVHSGNWCGAEGPSNSQPGRRSVARACRQCVNITATANLPLTLCNVHSYTHTHSCFHYCYVLCGCGPCESTQRTVDPRTRRPSSLTHCARSRCSHRYSHPHACHTRRLDFRFTRLWGPGWGRGTRSWECRSFDHLHLLVRSAYTMRAPPPLRSADPLCGPAARFGLWLAGRSCWAIPFIFWGLIYCSGLVGWFIASGYPSCSSSCGRVAPQVASTTRSMTPS